MTKKDKDLSSIEIGKKSGIVTLAGRSNVGKSTLLNSLIGTKIAIVTHRPQTTRNILHGVLNSGEGQAVFIDTPGILKEKGNPLAGKMTKQAEESLYDIDVIIYVVDPTKKIGSEEKYMLSLIRKAKAPKILVINKSDLPEKEKLYIDDYKALSDNFIAVHELSALRNRHIEPLKQKVFELLPEGEMLYPADQITNTDHKFWVAEIIREKIFLALRQEVPYSVHVEVESIEDKKDLFVIKAMVYTLNSKYKKMIIGSRGRALKEVGIAARKELEVALNRKIFLELEVSTDKHWEQRI